MRGKPGLSVHRMRCGSLWRVWQVYSPWSIFEDKDQNCSIVLFASTLLGNPAPYARNIDSHFPLEILSLTPSQFMLTYFLWGKFLLNWLFSTVLGLRLTMLAWPVSLEVNGAPSKDSKIKTDPQEYSMEKHMGVDTEKDTFLRTSAHHGGTWIILPICFSEWR